ncbi:MAG TPA: ATP-binding cassette domain-containing protein [Pseudonocardiaceae bacterium]
MTEPLLTQDTTTPTPLRAEGVTVRYHTPSGTVTALHDITLAIPRGRLTVLAGPSGSGKSTLLRILGLLERPTTGTVHLDGQPVSNHNHRTLRALRRRHVVTLFQNPADNLLDYLTVADNLTAAAQLAGHHTPPPDLLDRLGLAGTAHQRTHALSGGQKQRLALACALATGARIVLADEPTSQLDPASAHLVFDSLTRLVEWGTTVVATSHDPDLIALGHTVARLRDGELVDITHTGAQS